MAILAGFMVPHPPMIVPAVGRGSEKQVEKTIRAYEQTADEIAEEAEFFTRSRRCSRRRSSSQARTR